MSIIARAGRFEVGSGSCNFTITEPGWGLSTMDEADHRKDQRAGLEQEVKMASEACCTVPHERRPVWYPEAPNGPGSVFAAVVRPQ